MEDLRGKIGQVARFMQDTMREDPQALEDGLAVLNLLDSTVVLNRDRLPRRLPLESTETDEIYQHPAFTFYKTQGFVTVEDKRIFLTSTENRLLACLTEHPNWVTTHQQILDYVWPSEYMDKDIIKAHMSHLRDKIPVLKGLIKTHQGHGYLLVDPSRENQINGYQSSQ